MVEASNEAINPYGFRTNEVRDFAGFNEDEQSPIAIIKIKEEHNQNYVASKENEGMSFQSLGGHPKKLVIKGDKV